MAAAITLLHTGSCQSFFIIEMKHRTQEFIRVTRHARAHSRPDRSLMVQSNSPVFLPLEFCATHHRRVYVISFGGSFAVNFAIHNPPLWVYTLCAGSTEALSCRKTE